MASHGDETAEFLLNRTFNTYNARAIIAYIHGLSKKRDEAIDTGVKSEDEGKHTVDYNTDYLEIKDLNGFKAEKMSSFEFAAVKAYAVKERFGFDCKQVKDCLLYKSVDYAKLKSPRIKHEILGRVAELYTDKAKIADIVTAAKMEDMKVEQELFAQLPYRNKNMTPETDRAVQVNNIKEEVFRDKSVTVKKYINSKDASTKERITARAKSASQAKVVSQKSKTKAHEIGQYITK